MNNKAKMGCIPNSKQKIHALKNGKKPDIEKLLESAVPWDTTQQPPIIEWDNEYRNHLEKEAQKFDELRKKGSLEQWWQIAQKNGLVVKSIFLDSQGNKGSCAGVSMFERCYLTAMLKQIGMGAEMRPEKINPMVTYAQSLGCRKEGDWIPDGQTIAAVLKAAAEIGTYPAKEAGDYDERTRYKKDWEKLEKDAEERQMGVCPLTDQRGESLRNEEMVEAIELALRANKVVEVGNSVAISENTNRDKNGINIPTIGGYWSHATCFTGIKEVNGDVYYRWENSHGYIYHNNDESPNVGTWLNAEQLRRFCSGSFMDAGIVEYVEAPHYENQNLNP